MRCHPVSSGPSRSTEAVVSLLATPAVLAGDVELQGPSLGLALECSEFLALWNSCRQILQHKSMSHAAAKLEFGMLRLDGRPSGSPRA